MTLENKQNEGLKILEEWSKNKYFEIEDKKFILTEIDHSKRLKIYAYFTKIEQFLMLKNYSFLPNKDFQDVFKEIENNVLYSDALISKIPNFWDNNPAYYLQFIEVSFRVISYSYIKNIEINKLEWADQLEEWSSKNYFNILDKEFKIDKLTHLERLDIFAVYSGIRPSLAIDNYSFLSDPAYEIVFKQIENKVLFNGEKISEIKNFWNDNLEYFLRFLYIAFSTISYPLEPIYSKKKDSMN